MEMNIQFMQANMEKYRSELDEMKVNQLNMKLGFLLQLIQLHNDNIDKDLYHDKIVADYQVNEFLFVSNSKFNFDFFQRI